jgi:hypothetical protein
MQVRAWRLATVGIAAFALLASAAMAQTALVRRLGLAEMSRQAGWIARGTVTAVELGFVSVGERELPTVSYRLKVTEAFKGQLGQEKVIQMLDPSRIPPAESQQLRRVPVLPAPPRLEMGREYFLLSTPPGAAGLSSPVGLQQGCFEIQGAPGLETAENSMGNLGLSRGPVSYSVLAAAVRAALAHGPVTKP